MVDASHEHGGDITIQLYEGASHDFDDRARFTRRSRQIAKATEDARKRATSFSQSAEREISMNRTGASRCPTLPKETAPAQRARAVRTLSSRPSCRSLRCAAATRGVTSSADGKTLWLH